MPKSLHEQLNPPDPMRVIGLISGTSCDGVDAALCEIGGEGQGHVQIKLLDFVTEPYSKKIQQDVLKVSRGESRTEEVCRLNFRLGATFARAAMSVLMKAGLKPSDIHAVGSHGQTVAHLPPRFDSGIMATGISERIGSTLQLGEAAMIAEQLEVPVVSNFRTRDMAAGGQGAPLIPYIDYLLLTHPEHARLAVNIGGITNFTYLPAGAQEEEVLAFDTGPGNMLIDAMIQLMTLGKQGYDKDGELAAQGEVDGYILSELLKHEFLKRKPPKSTGREEFGLAYAKQLYEWGIKRAVKPKDTLRTVTDFTAIALSEAYKNWIEPKGRIGEIIVSGGGALNATLMARVKKEFGKVEFHLSDDFGLPVKAKEAIGFAVLARETLRGRPGNLRSATGAFGPRILGQITPA
ncbi:MAG: anhydro-N-acetylmuramic acid kinase [Planctomycetota bacterium]|nr:anhydro-N-acetylmuramic acid kinase [Planctomycetota bacterium]